MQNLKTVKHMTTTRPIEPAPAEYVNHAKSIKCKPFNKYKPNKTFTNCESFKSLETYKTLNIRNL